MTLLSEIQPNAQALYSAVGEVLQELHAEDARSGVDAALDAIVKVLGAERGLLLVREQGSEQIRHARHKAGPLPASEWEEISRTIVRGALEAGKTQVWDAFDAETDNASMTEIGILAAAATPVGAPGGPTRGVLYVDIRTPGRSIGETHERFLEIAASILAHGVRTERAEQANSELRRAEGTQQEPLSIVEIVSAPSMATVAEGVEAALGSDLNVLIQGASGVGKTALALALAEAMQRGKTVRATLGTSDDLNTITSEIFGHERGAFSGATARRVGLVEHANKGVLIFDEVLNLPLHAQQLLLDFTQFGTYRPLGHEAPEPRHADVRIIAATQGNLEAAIEEGRFRRDLYYRLAGIELSLPGLAERREEVPGLAEALLRRIDPTRVWHLSLPLRRLLTRGEHPWLGNLRELEAVLVRARHRALRRSPDACVIQHVDAEPELGDVGTLSVPPCPPAMETDMAGKSVDAALRWAGIEQTRDALALEEARILGELLGEEKGVVSRVARRIGLPRTTLIHRLQLLGVSNDS